MLCNQVGTGTFVRSGFTPNPPMLACARGPKEQSRAHPSLFEMDRPEPFDVTSDLVPVERPYGERTPSAETVSKWHLKTPADFIFAAKVPQIVTHEKMLVDCELEFKEFVDRMQILDDKLGPLLFQFPKFNKYVMNENEFLRRLRFLLARVKDSPVRFVVEIRNKTWLTERNGRP
jgi:Protein of unknown function DUF72